MRRLGLVNASIGKAIALRPQLLACDIENGWQRLVKYFKFLGIQDAGIQRIFCVHPSVFCMNLEKNIAPKVKLYHTPDSILRYYISKFVLVNKLCISAVSVVL